MQKGTLVQWASVGLSLVIALGSLWYKIDSSIDAQDIKINRMDFQIKQVIKNQDNMFDANKELTNALYDFSTAVTQLQVTVENNTKALEKLENKMSDQEQRFRDQIRNN